MKMYLLATALLLGAPALAQDMTGSGAMAQPPMDAGSTPPTGTDAGTTMPGGTGTSTGTMGDPAMGTTTPDAMTPPAGDAMQQQPMGQPPMAGQGMPQGDASSAMAGASGKTYPACSRTVTDNCMNSTRSSRRSRR